MAADVSFKREQKIMNQQSIEQAHDDDLRHSFTVMRRVAQRTREIVQKNGTKIVISRDDQIEHLQPDLASGIHESPAGYGEK